MCKIGVQWQLNTKAVVEYNQLLLPRVLMGINCYNLEFWQKLQGGNPNSVRIFRFYPNFDEELGISLDQPELLAVESARLLKKKVGYLATTGAVTHFLGMNEWVHSFEHAKHGLADRFMSTFIPAARDEVGLPVVVLNAACGHFAEETADLFPLTLEKLALEVDLPPQQKSYLGFHEYDWPTMDRIHREGLAKGDGGYWLCGKWKRMMPAIRARYGPIQAIVTEAGVDGGVAGHGGKGFRGTMPDLDSAVRLYCGSRSLYWYKQLADEDDAIYAIILFGLSMGTDWASFDIKGTDVPRLVYQMPNWEPKEEPKPNGGEKMSLENIKVFKLNPQGGHTELTTLADKEALIYGRYGAAFRRADVAEGQKVYRLVELWEKTGHSSLITNVVNENGSPMANVSVTLYWPNAPKPPDPPTTVYDHDWHDRFIWGPTNANGDVGPGMGTGAYHAEGAGGPHAVWIHDANIPSDICEKLGMIAGTFHDHLDQKFQLRAEEEKPEPEPEPEPGPWKLIEDWRKSKPGAHSIVGYFPESGTVFYVNGIQMVSGSKPEYNKDGKGGFEFVYWSPGMCDFEVGGQELLVRVAMSEIVHIHFERGDEPEQARLVSTQMNKKDAKAMLQALEQQYPGVFSLEV